MKEITASSSGDGGGGGSSSRRMWEFPDEVLEHVLVFLTESKDRNAVSAVCRAWCKTESECRSHVFIGNCYSIAPSTVCSRFHKLRSLTLKGKPRFADFNLLPHNWGAYLMPWVVAMSQAQISLEVLYLKRMCVSDESLSLIASSFPNFRSIVLNICDGFSTDGLASIARHCRNLEELQVLECLIDDRGGGWFRAFPASCNRLVSLNFACLESSIDFDVLESLVHRCSASLRTLGLNKRVTLRQLHRLLRRAPNLVDLWTGSFNQEMSSEQLLALTACFSRSCLSSLSGIWDYSESVCLAVVRPVCPNLTFLNLSYASVAHQDLVQLLSCCPKLQRLWLLDVIEDSGLRTVGSTCSDLRELRVFPNNPRGPGVMTEEGLLALADGCKQLSSLLYFCRTMTNAAMISASRSWSESLRRFRLCLIRPWQPDHLTGEPLDEGFGAIVRNCTRLKRLAVSGLLTDQAFAYIGEFGKMVETLSVAFAADSDLAMECVLRGCSSLRKLEIRDSPFGDAALLSGMQRYESSMRFLWLSSCRVTVMGCDELSKRMPRLNVEVVKESNEDEYTPDNVYVYRTVLPSARPDRPPNVIGLRGGEFFFHPSPPSPPRPPPPLQRQQQQEQYLEQQQQQQQQREEEDEQEHEDEEQEAQRR